MKSLFLLIFLLFSISANAAVVPYELVATQGHINLSGKKTVDFALLVNGQLPAPTLEFNEGDIAEIVLKNQLPDQEVSIHWHGILLPPEMDGVPYLNTPPIHPGESFTYRFPLLQAGTYWYHTHTNVQEQKGVYGAFVIHPKQKTIRADREAVLVLSDWSDEDALDIIANLRKDGEYYRFKKDTIRSITGAMQAGALGVYFGNEWTRMGGMDASDVGYDAFLINGKREQQLTAAKAGETLRLRIINAASSTYFHLALGDAPMQVVAMDGIDIKPVRAQEILIGMAETYDVLFTLPEQRNYEFKATAQDGTGFASAWIGAGPPVAAPVKAKPNLYESMDHGAHAGHQAPGEHAGHGEHAEHNEHAGHEGHAETPVVPMLTVDEVAAQKPLPFPKNEAVHDVKLVLDGDMERYVWHINGKAIFEDRTITIKEGEWVRFTFVNNTMMHHPMHLHGHFFRVINSKGDEAPWKHTVDVSPHMTRTIEFRADQPGQWMLHCHNLYHMKTGMARVIQYAGYTPKPEIAAHQKHDPHNHDHTYAYGMLEAATNHAQAKFRLTQTWNELDLRLETRKDYSWDLEGDLLYKRWQDKYLHFILGGSTLHHETRGVAGVGYLLPMLVHSTLLVDHEGELRLDLEKRLQWTSFLFTDMDFTFRQDQRTEWELSLMYARQWSWAVGVKVTEDSQGVGVQYQF